MSAANIIRQQGYKARTHEYTVNCNMETLEEMACFLEKDVLGKADFSKLSEFCDQNQHALQRHLSRGGFLRLKQGDPRELRSFIRGVRYCANCGQLPESFGNPDPGISNPQYEQFILGLESGVFEEIRALPFSASAYQDPRYLVGDLYLRCLACGSIWVLTKAQGDLGSGGYCVA